MHDLVQEESLSLFRVEQTEANKLVKVLSDAECQKLLKLLIENDGVSSSEQLKEYASRGTFLSIVPYL